MIVFSPPGALGPRDRGRAHGEAFRGMIAEIADIRLGLTMRIGGFSSEAQVLGLAARHVPLLERYDTALHEELLGIAEGANLDAARVVVLNHYTDLRDISPEHADELARRDVEGDAPAEEDCSAVFARTPEGSVLGQTWDMHGSAHPFVMMLHVPAREGAPAAWVFTITGCLGMTGMNAHGVGLTINNLKSLDAKVGVVWPALVRRALREASAERARDVILESPLGSGHHYLVADHERAFGIEASGTRSKVVYDGAAESYVHTNHCLDPEMAEVHTIAAESTTQLRFDTLTESVRARAIAGREDLWTRLGTHDGYPKSVCTHMATPEAPHKMRTCGGLAMDLERKDVWAAAGCLHHARPHVFDF